MSVAEYGDAAALEGFVPPSWGTPRNHDRETRGAELALVARKLGLDPKPHHRYVFDVLGEIDPDTGKLWYSEGGIYVNRQVGKTMGLLFPIGVHRCTVVPHRLGYQNVAFVMQDRQMAREKLEHDMAVQLELAEEQGAGFRQVNAINAKARPGRSTQQWRLGLNNGSEHLQFGKHNMFRIRTPSKSGGHGGTLDLGLADEIRFHVDDRVERAMVPGTQTRAEPQLVCASTAGDDESLYMYPKVIAGRKAVEDGLETRVAHFEWRIPPDADLEDPLTWLTYHPGAATGMTTVEFLLGELDKAMRSPDERKLDTFLNEYANQWVRVPVLGTDGQVLLVPANVWADRKTEAAGAGGPCTLGVDLDPDGSVTSITKADYGVDGAMRFRVLRVEAGTAWLERGLAEQIAEHDPVAVAYDAGGPTNAEAGAIKRAAAPGTVPIVRLRGTEWTSACDGWVKAMTDGRYMHTGQQWLTSALEGATKKHRGQGWLLDRQTALSDITPLAAAVAAARALELHDPEAEDPDPMDQIG